ncbi:MAG: peptide chain release factor N(5)-glutamine methyltransferase [Clostridia bacterium]|nr:peptide chain release factor N(5)-glutamine methyltransferase [Clostridia bacterium]
MVSLWDCFQQLRQALSAMGIEEADLEARELVACAAGLDARNTAGWKTAILTPEIRQKADAFFERRKREEPLAYILGEWDFYGNRFFVTPDVLIPRGDTEWLCDAAVQAARAMWNPRVLDLCCGSGCIGISIALAVPGSQITVLDYSEAALEVTRKNAALHHVKEPKLKIRQGDALQPDSIDGIFDIIVSNPPYITAQEMAELDRSVDAYEPHLALYGGTDGLDFYRAMAERPAFQLAEGGKLFAECGWKQGQQAAALFSAAGWKNVHLCSDLAGIPRIVCAEK